MSSRILHPRRLLVACAFLPIAFQLPTALKAQTTTASTLADFGVEEPMNIYFPRTNLFATNDGYVNITDSTTNSNLGAGVFQMELRYVSNSNTTWWDGDRTTLETDRGRTEVKNLGPNQAKGDTYIYSTTWRTSPNFVASGSFCHITQLKPVDGVEGSSGAPLITTTIGGGNGSGTVNVDLASASFSPANVWSPHSVRSFAWTANTWTTEMIKVKPSSDGELTGLVQVSVGGDAYQGLTNVEVCRPNTTVYYPKWGLYRKTTTASNFTASSYIQHSQVSASLVPLTTPSTPATASTSATGYPPSNTVDGVITAASRWAGKGNGATIQWDLGTNYTMSCIYIAFPFSNIYSFDLQTSTDGTTWTTQLANQTANGSINVLEKYALPAVTARYVRYLGHGSTADTWNNISEVQIYGFAISTAQVKQPVFSVDGGSYATTQSVTITTATSGATLYYTTDGTTPSSSSTVYTGPVSIGSSKTLKAIAIASGKSDSSITVATYTIQTAAPVASIGAGTYVGAQAVSLSSATTGAQIYYTTDGSTPSNTHGTLYTGGTIAISATSTLQAIAYSSSLPVSGVSSSDYTIWTDVDIGSPALAGSASYSGGTLTVQGAGADIWGSADQFNYAYQAVSGDATVTAEVTSQTNTNAWAKCGVMFRNSTAAGDMSVDLVVTPGNGISMQYRATSGGATVDLIKVAGLAAPYWVQLIRSGNTFTGYYSPDQVNWTQIGAITIAMNANATAGMAVCAHNTTTLNTTTFVGATVEP